MTAIISYIPIGFVSAKIGRKRTIQGALLQYVSYRTLFPYACVFTAAAMLTMSMVHHGDSRPAVKKNILENFDVED